MPRIARIVGIGYPHHIIQRGNNRQDIFFDQEDRRLYLKWLEKYSLECDCTVHAYCLMKNHVHLLAVPQNSYSLAKTMQKLSLRFTQHINKKYKRTGDLLRQQIAENPHDTFALTNLIQNYRNENR